MKLANKPINARPLFVAPCEDSYAESSEQDGMTLLEYYAGLAMQAQLISIGRSVDLGNTDGKYLGSEFIAQDAIGIAKALIAELEKQQRNPEE